MYMWWGGGFNPQLYTTYTACKYIIHQPNQTVYSGHIHTISIEINNFSSSIYFIYKNQVNQCLYDS